MKRFFLSLLMISVSVIAMAQSASMLSMARAELDKRGLTEAEVRARLLQDGINPEAIPPTEYPKYQGRVMAILDELQAQKAGAAGTAAAAPAEEIIVLANATDSLNYYMARLEKAMRAIESSVFLAEAERIVLADMRMLQIAEQAAENQTQYDIQLFHTSDSIIMYTAR